MLYQIIPQQFSSRRVHIRSNRSRLCLWTVAYVTGSLRLLPLLWPWTSASLSPKGASCVHFCLACKKHKSWRCLGVLSTYLECYIREQSLARLDRWGLSVICHDVHLRWSKRRWPITPLLDACNSVPRTSLLYQTYGNKQPLHESFGEDFFCGSTPAIHFPCVSPLAMCLHDIIWCDMTLYCLGASLKLRWWFCCSSKHLLWVYLY